MSIGLKEKEILSLLSPNTSVSIKTIAKKLYISEPTARRYLAKLSDEGYVIRTHGGCMLNYVKTEKDIPLYVRLASNNEGKQQIAKKAATLIEASKTIFLDASSTVFQLIPYLKDINNLTVITNGLKTAMALTEMNVKTFCTGGFISQYNMAMSSMSAIDAIKMMNADMFFFSCESLAENGTLVDNSYEETFIRRAIMKQSAVNVLLIDNSKIFKNGKFKYNLATLREIDYCISNVKLADDLAEMPRKGCL